MNRTPDNMTTEQRNAESMELDQMTARQIVALMNRQDALVTEAIARVADPIARAIDAVARAFRQGGRLIYVGAGTSGRLGVLDAAECPPTFNTPPEMVVGIIAGGSAALTRAIEGAEDEPARAVQDLEQHALSSRDVLVGIATSGQTPYVLAALDHGRSLGASTIGLTCNDPSRMDDRADLIIAPVVGPEVLSGSTRLKAGTATKLVLNMLTTGAMVLLGKTYGNWMVDLRATNSKLRRRSIRIVSEVAGVDADTAVRLLRDCDGSVKLAILVALGDLAVDQARRRLAETGGRLREALAIDPSTEY